MPGFCLNWNRLLLRSQWTGRSCATAARQYA